VPEITITRPWLKPFTMVGLVTETQEFVAGLEGIHPGGHADFDAGLSGIHGGLDRTVTRAGAAAVSTWRDIAVSECSQAGLQIDEIDPAGDCEKGNQTYHSEDILSSGRHIDLLVANAQNADNPVTVTHK
jgi:hypothetical protein